VRTIRIDSEPDAELEEARKKWSRLEDAWIMIEWALSRDPTKGNPLSESGRARSFVFDGSWAHHMPTIEVLYTIDDPHYVTIKAIRISDPTYSAGTA